MDQEVKSRQDGNDDVMVANLAKHIAMLGYVVGVGVLFVKEGTGCDKLGDDGADPNRPCIFWDPPWRRSVEKVCVTICLTSALVAGHFTIFRRPVPSGAGGKGHRPSRRETAGTPDCPLGTAA
jgi:hypothetical protein